MSEDNSFRARNLPPMASCLILGLVACRAQAGSQANRSQAGGDPELSGGQPATLRQFRATVGILNAAFNVDTATRRLRAVSTLAERFNEARSDIQKRLLELAVAELDDALDVLSTTTNPDALEQLGKAKQEIALGLAAGTWVERQTRTSNAILQCQCARSHFGSNIDFVPGTGNRMF